MIVEGFAYLNIGNFHICTVLSFDTGTDSVCKSFGFMRHKFLHASDCGLFEMKGWIFMNLPVGSGVYFIGIGGISMSSLALILKKRGIRVAGYDFKPSDNTRLLEKNDIPVFYTYAPENQEDFDTVVFTAAIAETDPEFVCAKKRGAKILSRAELLGMLVDGYTHSIGVAGTHGKSTTTGMLAHIFAASNSDATVLAGAVIPSLGSTYHAGHGDTAVFEACEYKNSYHAMHPTLRLVLNCEFDHVDFFGNMENVIASFRKYLETDSGREENLALINADCPGSVKAAEGISTKTYTFSIKDPSADFYAADITGCGGYEEFDIYALGRFYCHAKPGVPGMHNVANATAAAGAAYLCGISGKAVSDGLASFGGVKRRFERLGTMPEGAVVIDDYAHHPDEIRATLKAAKAICQGKVYCIFQPHTYSRFTALMPSFAETLSLADVVIMADIYAARETNENGVSSADIRKYLSDAEYFPDFESIAAFVKEHAGKDDMVITMGAGDIDKIAPLLLK